MKKNEILFITDSPINRTGGLERAVNNFKDWIIEESYSCSNINKNNFYKKIQKIFSADLILVIGHRSIFILFYSIFLFLFKKKVVWCAFWHDYRKEKKRNLFFYKIYDKFFNFVYKKSKLHLVVSDYEAKMISTPNKTRKIKLPSSFICNEKELYQPRDIDVFIPGRDVPHKRYKLIREICIELGLKYLETNEKFISEEELRKTYISSKYIFVPSLYESYSYIAIEGLSCGCNVLVSDNVMIKDRLKIYNNLKVLDSNKWNPESVKKLLNTFPPNNNNINNAIKIQKEFSFNSCKKDFLKKLNIN